MKTIAQRKRRTTLVTLVRRLRRRVGQMFSAEGHGRDRSRPAGAKRRPARWATPTRATRLCLEMGWSPRRPGSGRGRMGSAKRSEFHDKGASMAAAVAKRGRRRRRNLGAAGEAQRARRSGGRHEVPRGHLRARDAALHRSRSQRL